jgi:hypothetical protein
MNAPVIDNNKEYEKWINSNGISYTRQDLINYLEHDIMPPAPIGRVINNSNNTGKQEIDNISDIDSSDSECSVDSTIKKVKENKKKKKKIIRKIAQKIAPSESHELSKQSKSISIVTCFNKMYDKNKSYFDKFVNEEEILIDFKDKFKFLNKKKSYILLRKLVYNEMKRNYKYILNQIKRDIIANKIKFTERLAGSDGYACFGKEESNDATDDDAPDDTPGDDAPDDASGATASDAPDKSNEAEGKKSEAMVNEEIIKKNLYLLYKLLYNDKRTDGTVKIIELSENKENKEKWEIVDNPYNLFEEINKVNFTTSHYLDEFVIKLVSNDNNFLSFVYYYTKLHKAVISNSIFMESITNYYSETRKKYIVNAIYEILKQGISIASCAILEPDCISDIYDVKKNINHSTNIYNELLRKVMTLMDFYQ